MIFSINIGNIIHINNISQIFANIIGLTSYWVPQNPMWYCWYISESADVWNYDTKGFFKDSHIQIAYPYPCNISKKTSLSPCKRERKCWISSWISSSLIGKRRLMTWLGAVGPPVCHNFFSFLFFSFLCFCRIWNGRYNRVVRRQQSTISPIWYRHQVSLNSCFYNRIYGKNL